jgi:hypothetical protein
MAAMPPTEQLDLLLNNGGRYAIDDDVGWLETNFAFAGRYS